MSGIVSFIINNKFDGVQCKILLYIAYSKKYKTTVKALSEKLNETQKDIIQSLETLKSPSFILKIDESGSFIVDFKNRETVFEIENDTRYKILKKNDEINDKAKELGEIWKKVCNKPKSEIKDKRLRVLKKALEKYGFEKAEKSIIGCSKTLWNMGYDDHGEKLNKRYVDLSLIFRNEEYVERFIENSELPSIEEQIEQIKTKKNTLKKTNKISDAQDQRNDWLENRLSMFGNEEEPIKRISQK